MSRPATLLPVQPIADALASRIEVLAGHPTVKEVLGDNLARSYWRAAARGSMTAVLADRLCVKGLHVHPAFVFEEWSRL